MVRYELSDSLATETVLLDELPSGWRRQENWTQQRGDDWCEACEAPLLKVPSAIVPIANSPDLNVLINHRHQDATAVKIVAADPFVFDPRLF